MMMMQGGTYACNVRFLPYESPMHISKSKGLSEAGKKSEIFHGGRPRRGEKGLLNG